jgi:hypothetical protein
MHNVHLSHGLFLTCKQKLYTTWDKSVMRRSKERKKKRQLCTLSTLIIAREQKYYVLLKCNPWCTPHILYVTVCKFHPQISLHCPLALQNPAYSATWSKIQTRLIWFLLCHLGNGPWRAWQITDLIVNRVRCTYFTIQWNRSSFYK